MFADLREFIDMTLGSHVAGYKCNYIIVVDDDIDPSNISEYCGLWALEATRRKLR